MFRFIDGNLTDPICAAIVGHKHVVSQSKQSIRTLISLREVIAIGTITGGDSIRKSKRGKGIKIVGK